MSWSQSLTLTESSLVLCEEHIWKTQLPRRTTSILEQHWVNYWMLWPNPNALSHVPPTLLTTQISSEIPAYILYITDGIRVQDKSKFTHKRGICSSTNLENQEALINLYFDPHFQMQRYSHSFSWSKAPIHLLEMKSNLPEALRILNVLG